MSTEDDDRIKEDMIKFEQDLNKALEKSKQTMNRLRETNSGIISEIESMGQQIDLTIPRLEHFMVFLIEVGVITEQQMIDSAIAWERNLKEQIVPIVRQLRERRAETIARLQQEAKAATKGKSVQISPNAGPPPESLLKNSESPTADHPLIDGENS